MSRVRGALFCCLVGVASVGCETRYVQTAEEPAPRDAGPRVDARVRVDAHVPPKPCGATLASRLTIARVDVAEDIRYRRLGYNLIPEDDRIAFSIGLNGTASIAWVEANAGRVHVTSLDATLARVGDDAVVEGNDVGGLVAQADGAAVLVTRADPGAPLPDPAASGAIGRAAVLVRIRNGVEATLLPLTGTTSVVAGVVGAARDCIASPLNGRLEWNGMKYGAYFAVHGCEGDAHASYYGDKLVYLDDSGRALPGGWAWNCSIDEGLRLLAGPSSFTPICLSDGAPAAGLNLVVEGRSSVLLAPELSASGYSAGSLGSIVQMGDGTFAIGWLSRGVRSAGGRTTAERAAPDIAYVALDRDRHVAGPVTWLSDTPDVAELGLHLAPYGPDRILATWEEFGQLQCNGQTCDGAFQGTHARLLDASGHFLTPDEVIAATPNELEDIRVFPTPVGAGGGDLGFAFVDVGNRDRAASRTLPDGGAPAPPVRTLNVARLAYCK